MIAHKKLEINSAIYIQNMWRTRVSRQLVANMRNAIAEEESALYVFVCWWWWWWCMLVVCFAWSAVKYFGVFDGTWRYLKVLDPPKRIRYSFNHVTPLSLFPPLSCFHPVSFPRYIQSWWRAVLGYREGQARLTAHRNQLKRYKGAVTIQNCWRCFVARKKADHKQLVRACLRVQNAWRCKQGRQSAHLVSSSSVFVMLSSTNNFVACKKWM